MAKASLKEGICLKSKKSKTVLVQALPGGGGGLEQMPGLAAPKWAGASKNPPAGRMDGTSIVAQVKVRVDSPQILTFVQTVGLGARLTALKTSLIFSSCQSGLFYIFDQRPDGAAHLHQLVMAVRCRLGQVRLKWRSLSPMKNRKPGVADGCLAARDHHANYN